MSPGHSHGGPAGSPAGGEAGADDSAPHQHRSYAPEQVGVAIVTVSDSRSLEDDKSGAAIAQYLEAAGHRVVTRAIVPDDAARIREAALGAAARADVDAVIATGGTGISPRDVTPDTLEPLFGRILHGFGELFRQLSFAEIGAAAWLSRATAGTRDGVIFFVLPGSSGAVKLAMERLLLPELPHAVGQLRRG